ncbi:MAG TPA: helix-turn-helix transcriptional regulator [Solirubrobacterales bacterium]|jgi:transcriptional regulator with XRE-family HTH domain|nr:helix-turn-helix transcriptional regulator [Solirubrobacterales bacterium]
MSPRGRKSGRDVAELESRSAETGYEVELLADAVIGVVRGLMESNRISQKELADRLRVSEARVSRILNGDGANMKLSMVAALGRAVGVRFALAPIPFADREGSPAAVDGPPPRWLARQRRLIAETTVAVGASRPPDN